MRMQTELTRKRDKEMARLYVEERLHLHEIASIYNLEVATVRRALTRLGVTLRDRGRRGAGYPQAKVKLDRVRPRGEELGPYPLRMEPPRDKIFCTQCDRLRKPAEVRACPSPWCKAKART